MSKSLIATVKEQAVSWFWDFFNSPNGRETVIGVVFVGAVFVGGYWYRSFVQARELQAHRIFSESYDLYEQAMHAEYSKDIEKSQQLWQEAEMMFENGYLQNRRSYLAPYFLAFEAETLSRQGKFSKALAKMDEVVSNIAKSDAIYGVYAVKRSLMKLDSPDALVQKEGLLELEQQADDSSNTAQDVASYYAGLYYWTTHDQEKARSLWQNIKETAVGDVAEASPWKADIENKI